MAKIANLRHKTGQIPLLSLDINGHNSIIFHPILTSFILNCLLFQEPNRMVSKLKRYIFWLIFWCLAPFFLRGLTWVKLCAWTQNHPKNSGRVLPFPFNPYLIIKVSKIIGLNPPLKSKKSTLKKQLKSTCVTLKTLKLKVLWEEGTKLIALLPNCI